MEEQKNTAIPQENQDEEGLDLAALASNFLRIAKKTWWMFFLLAALGVCIMYVVSYLNYTPTYRCEATFTITSGDGSNLYSSINSASQLSRTFPYILDSNYFRSVLMDTLGTDALNGTIDAETISSSNMVTMFAESPSPEDARAMLEAALEIYPEVSRFVLGDIAFNLIDEIKTPTAPMNEPSLHRILGYGMMGGLCLAALVIGLVALFSNTIKTTEDMESISSMVCLGALPEMHAKARKKSTGSKYFSALDPRTTHGFRESMRAINARFGDALAERGAKTVLVTSSIAGEGKSTVAINLAEQLAQGGSSVLLVDMDLRRQQDATLLGCKRGHSPTEVLSKHEIQKIDFISLLKKRKIYFWGGNKTTDHSIETLGNPKLHQVLNALRKRMDYIIIDTPPCGVFQDTAVLADWADAVLFVVRFDKVSRRNVQEALSMLEGRKAAVLGYVLNGCPQTSSGYGYGYGRYGYGKYGYGTYGAKYGELPTEEAEENAALTLQ